MEANSQQPAWELSKENIQPLKSGRKASKLATIAQPLDLKALNEERQHFENELRMYNGEDPLEPWYKYISWVEQEYSRGGKEGGIDKLIESCIRQFKDEKSVNNDQRFVEIWLKYAALSAKPLEVFDFMFNNGLCTQKPDLFEAWAWYLESSNSVKKAESVFLKGIGAMISPETKERLTVRQKQFQARVIRRLNGEEIPEEETEEEKRSALGQLRAHGKKAKVGSVRVGAAKLGGPGVLQTGTVKQPLKTNNSQAGFKIFTDENNPAVGAEAAIAGESRPLPSRTDTKENEMKAGPWTKAKVVKSSANIPLNSISQHSKPAFTVYEEPNLAQPTNTPQRNLLAAETRVLSTRKEASWELRCPVALFEPADPTKRSMYCKEKVYQGTTEFSLEELRALRWMEKNKQQEELNMIEKRKAELREQEMTMARKMAEQEETMARKLAEKEEAMARKMAEMERKMAEWQRMMTGGSEVLVQGNTGLMVTRPSLSEQPQQEPVPGFSRQVSLDTTANLLAANPLGGGGRNKSSNNTVTPTATPSPHALKNSVLSQPSPTLNTKEAMAAMVNLWSKPVGEEVDQDPQPLQESGHSASSVPFQIYTDSATSSSNFEIFCDSGSSAAPPAQDAPAPFPIFCDENAAPAPVLKLPTINRRSRSESLNRHEDKENSPIGTDDEENQPPQGYAQPKLGARPKVGILQEARNIKSVPLDVQEKILDEDERRQEQEMQDEVFKSPIGKNVKSVNKPEMPKPFGGNQTIMLPNEDDFERLAKMSSTPFTGKPSYQFENDENTCAVNILYKQVPEVDDMRPPPVPEEPKMTDRLDTIVETSREYYKSSSSSSGGDTLREGLNNRSHWGNTGHTVLHSNTRASEGGLSMARTPGQHLMTTTMASSVSGYLGDKSTNLTKSGVKDNKRELIASPAMVTSFEKRMKVLDNKEEEVDGFDEPTGMFGDMMAELKKNINQKELENSMQASFMEDAREEIPPTPGFAQRSHLNMTGALNNTGAPRLDMTGVAKLSVTGAPRLDMTGAGPRLDMTGVPRLEVTGAGPRLDMTGAGPRLDMTGAGPNMTGVPRLDMTGVAPGLEDLDEPGLDVTAPPPLDMSGLQEDELSSKTANLSLDEGIDPFHPSTHANLLGALFKPVSTIHGYVPQRGVMPNIRVRGNVSLGEDVFYISECKGEGGYAKVYAATRQDNDMDCTISGIDAVLKVQKPANDWEFYVCTEVQRRMGDDLMACAFMAIPRNYVFSDGGVFVSYHQKFGTLLDIINTIKTANVGKTCIEPMAIYFTIELLRMVEALHEVGIIHADLKADNLLLQSIPSLPATASSAEEMFSSTPISLQLIDFGRSIDMSLLPPGTSFTKVVTTDGIKCSEMRESKPWREHIDYFGLAAVAYCLLFQNYIETVKIDERWEVKGSYKRWWHQDIWRSFFSEMINIPGVDKESLPSLSGWRIKFQELFFKEKMAKHLKSLTNDVMSAMMSDN